MVISGGAAEHPSDAERRVQSGTGRWPRPPCREWSGGVTHVEPVVHVVDASSRPDREFCIRPNGSRAQRDPTAVDLHLPGIQADLSLEGAADLLPDSAPAGLRRQPDRDQVHHAHTTGSQSHGRLFLVMHSTCGQCDCTCVKRDPDMILHCRNVAASASVIV